jgi:chemotaxis protein histidine kinase CheA
MPENAEALVERSAIDKGGINGLMALSGELVIIRSQYVRTEKMLQQDLFRQKELLQGVGAAKVLLNGAIKDPGRFQKAVVELEQLFNSLESLARHDTLAVLVQGMGHTTGSLEKASSELQSGIVKLRAEILGSEADGSSAMAIVPALLVVVGEEICAFPLASVTEIVNVPKEEIYTVDGNTTMKLRDHALSLIELSRIIQFKANSQENDAPSQRVVVITDGKERLGVVVDRLLGKDEIVFKALTSHFSNVRGIVGASILADGNVALILDPAAIMQQSQ